MFIKLIYLNKLYVKLNFNEKLHSGNFPCGKFPRQTFRKLSGNCQYYSHINLLKLVNLLTSALFFHSINIVELGLLFLSSLVALLSPLVLNIA